MIKLSNLPPKGTSDWFPDQFSVRKYIFDTWREVCTKFGYEEYLTPVIESAEVYRAKSGEDVGGKELLTMTDRAGRELAIRPEMTPSVTRMVSRIYNDTPKPIRYFSIANFLRNEKPQRGRNREFWQLNFDIFGSNAIQADVEILQLSLEIMSSFKPPKGSYIVNINNRKLIDYILNQVAGVTEEQRTHVVRILDKWDKLSDSEIDERLKNDGKLTSTQITWLRKFMQSNTAADLTSAIPEITTTEGYLEIEKIMKSLIDMGYGDWINFSPNIIRGFDYYDGMVFEVFDKNPENNRAMFGGGRYNGLASLFGSQSFPAVGCAPGDETTKLFLESWDLLPKNLTSQRIFIPILGNSYLPDVQAISQSLRKQGKNIIMGLEVQKLSKALEFADKQGIQEVLLFGEDEKSKGIYKIRDMKSGGEREIRQ